jgi:hypothetical protein
MGSGLLCSGIVCYNLGAGEVVGLPAPRLYTLHFTLAAMTSDTFYAHACRIVENFNFLKVQKMMAAVDWNWGGPYMNGEFGPPTVDAMKSNAMHLLLQAKTLDTNTSAGGFQAYWVRQGDVAGYKGNGYIGLRFIGAETY